VNASKGVSQLTARINAATFKGRDENFNEALRAERKTTHRRRIV
jgi:hypothetical protein